MTTAINTAGGVAAEIKARLATIRLSDESSFETDIGRDVMMGRRTVPDDRPPCISVIEGLDDTLEQTGKSAAHIQQHYLIDGYDVCDPDNPNDQAHKMIRDVKRAIFGDGLTMGGKVRKVHYLGRDIGPRADGVALVQMRVMIAVEYIEDLANP